MKKILHEKILLLATNHVGNNMFCTPAIRLLKKHCPMTQIDIITMSSRGASVFEGNPDINKVYCTTRKKTIRRLATNYPLVIGLHYDKSREYLSGITHAISIPAPTPHQHRADEVLKFMQTLLECDIHEHDRNYVLHPQSQHFAEFNQKLDAENIFIGFHLGTGRTSVHGWKFWYRNRDKDARLWSLENYIALAHQLIAANPKIRCVITGSRNEKFLGKNFIREVPGTINLIGKTSLLGLAALMQKLRVFVTQDTGALHVACTADVSLVCLLGPTDPNRTGPYPRKPQHAIIKKNNMTEISIREVYDCILAALKI